MKANYKQLTVAYRKAVNGNDQQAIEQIYSIVDEKIHDLYHKDDTGTIPPGLLQKWEIFHGEICAIVNQIRKQPV